MVCIYKIHTVRQAITGTSYCGPGGFGQSRGPVDDACEEHDSSYTAPFLFDYVKSQKADKVFLRRLRKARPIGFRQSVTRAVALGYFNSKVNFWDTMSYGRATKKRAIDRSMDHKLIVPPSNQLVVYGDRIGSDRKWTRRAAPALPWYRSKRKFAFNKTRYVAKRRYFPKNNSRFRRSIGAKRRRY